MPVLTRSKSQYVQVGWEEGWGTQLAKDIDRAIHDLGRDRNVINISVTPLATAYTPSGASPTVGVVVTVVWRASGSDAV